MDTIKLYFIFFFFPVLGWCQIDKNGDFQVWQMTLFQEKITQNTKIRMEQEFRWGDDATKLFLSYTQWQWIYQSGVFEMAPAYRHIFFRTEELDWFPIYSPMLDVSFHVNFFAWDVIIRNRMQYLMDKFSNIFRFRHRYRFIYSFDPYSIVINQEFFFSEDGGYNQNRFSVGMAVDLSDKVRGKIIYMLRNHLSDKWRYQNILGIYLHLYF